MRSPVDEFRRLVETFDPKSREYWEHVGQTLRGLIPPKEMKLVHSCLGRLWSAIYVGKVVLLGQVAPLIPSIWFSWHLKPIIQSARVDYELPEHAQVFTELTKDELKEAHKLELGRREQFNRKAQAYLMGVTLSTSFAIGMLNIMTRAQTASSSPSWLSVVLRMALGIVVISLFMSAIAALKVIAPSDVFDMWLQERHISPDAEMEKKQLIKLTLLNQGYNLIAANYLSASYIAMRNGVYLILCFLLWLIMAG
jgi:hypothetical protein